MGGMKCLTASKHDTLLSNKAICVKRMMKNNVVEVRVIQTKDK